MEFRNLLYGSLEFFSPIYNYFTRNRLRILAYHDVPDQALFEEHIKFLSKNYNIITIDELAKHFAEKNPLPDKPLLISFDDGDNTVFRNGLPVLKKYRLPAVLFVITSLIGTETDFWWDIIRKNEKLNGLTDREIKRKINDHKNLPNSQRILSLSLYKRTSKVQLDVEHLKELEENHIYIGNHSHTHPMFNNCERREIEQEIIQVKKKFSEWEVGDFRSFAYPNGNYSQQSEELLKEKGISLAFLFDHKLNKRKMDPLRISRIAVDADVSMPEFKTKVSGLHSMIFHWKK